MIRSKNELRERLNEKYLFGEYSNISGIKITTLRVNKNGITTSSYIRKDINDPGSKYHSKILDITPRTGFINFHKFSNDDNTLHFKSTVNISFYSNMEVDGPVLPVTYIGINNSDTEVTNIINDSNYTRRIEKYSYSLLKSGNIKITDGTASIIVIMSANKSIPIIRIFDTDNISDELMLDMFYTKDLIYSSFNGKISTNNTTTIERYNSYTISDPNTTLEQIYTNSSIARETIKYSPDGEVEYYNNHLNEVSMRRTKVDDGILEEIKLQGVTIFKALYTSDGSVKEYDLEDIIIDTQEVELPDKKTYFNTIYATKNGSLIMVKRYEKDNHYNSVITGIKGDDVLFECKSQLSTIKENPTLMSFPEIIFKSVSGIRYKKEFIGDTLAMYRDNDYSYRRVTDNFSSLYLEKKDGIYIRDCYGIPRLYKSDNKEDK